MKFLTTILILIIVACKLSLAIPTSERFDKPIDSTETSTSTEIQKATLSYEDDLIPGLFQSNLLNLISIFLLLVLTMGVVVMILDIKKTLK